MKKRARNPYFCGQGHKIFGSTSPCFQDRGSRLGSLQAGFTFIELIFVIALIAIIYTFAAPQLGIRGDSAPDVKIGELVADIRNAYDLAVLSRSPNRLVFDFASGNYFLQTPDRDDFLLGDARLDRDLTAEEEAELVEEFEENFTEFQELAGEEVKSEDSDLVIPPSSMVLKAKDSLMPVVWTTKKEKPWRNKNLGPALLVQDMQAEHHGQKQELDEADDQARGMIYFFPNGYVEKAVIHIAFRQGKFGIDDSKTPYTVTTNPYEGTAAFESGYEEYDVHGNYKSLAKK